MINNYIALTLLIFSFLCGQDKPQAVDGVAAVVGENIILKSDVSQVVGMTALQRGLDVAKDVDLLLQLQEGVLSSLIDQKVILEMAKLDSIEIADKDVENALDQQVDGFIMRAGSEEVAETMLGQSLSDFRREFWYDMRDRLITEQYQQKLIMSVNINRSGVINFYDEYKDSLPEFPTKMKIRHLLIRIKAGEESKKEALEKINLLRKKILSGESFSSVAADFSDDPGSRAAGGSLGYIKRNQMVKEFETKAYTQDLNTLSEPIETTFGYHILETTEKSGEKIKVRHILISPKITEKDESVAYKFALGLRDSSTNLEKFKSLVFNKSEDEQTNKIGGDLGWITPGSSPIPEISKVLGFLEIGECSRPVKSSFGYHLLWLEEIRAGGKPSLSLHWTEIEEIALNHKRMVYFKDWVTEARNNFYIGIN
jgi:peptidyl-prolyl cis-trans isomerase SurA